MTDPSAAERREELQRFFTAAADHFDQFDKAAAARRSDLEGFFAGLQPARRIATLAQAELDRRAATSFSVFHFFREREEDLSRILASLLRPGEHGQQDLFLRLFLAELRRSGRKTAPPRDAPLDFCRTEFPTRGNRRIDIVLKLGYRWIGIENKPWAGEQHDQVAHYIEDLRARAPGNDPLLLYLSGNGKDAETRPKDGPEAASYLLMPWRDPGDPETPSVERWIEECRRRCAAERVRWFLADFLEYIRRVFTLNEWSGNDEK